MSSDKEQHSKKFEIFVNGVKKTWNEEQISFIEVIDLFFPPPHGPNEVFTVQYSKGPKDNEEGDLVEGQSVKVKSGMVFDVSRTNRS